MSEFIIYPEASVDSDGNTVVSPELIANLLSEVISNDHQGEYSEGDFGLTVKYADIKEFIEMAGHTVKEIALEKPDVAKADRERHHQACLDMLTSHGIDPPTVLRDGIYVDGYDRIELTAEGERIIGGDEIATEFVAWPKSFPVASFFEHYWAWRKAVA